MRRKLTKLAVLALALTGILCQPSLAATQDWYVASTMDGPIAFILDGEYVYLNSQQTEYGSTTYSLGVGGTWGVCGTVSGGVLTPDPYAQFEILRNTAGGNTGWPWVLNITGTPPMGRVHWLPGVPVGYTTNLLLGYSFAGDGAPTHTYQPTPLEPWGPMTEVTGTLVLFGTYMYGQTGDGTAVSHSFSVTYVPEPTSLLALLSGCGVLALRRRR
jgi:hypothetical protein